MQWNDADAILILLNCFSQMEWLIIQNVGDLVSSLFFVMNLGKPDYEQCDQKKSPNVYKSWPKMISLEKSMTLTPSQKLPKYVWDLGILIVSKGFKKSPKVQ